MKKVISNNEVSLLYKLGVGYIIFTEFSVSTKFKNFNFDRDLRFYTLRNIR